MSFYMPPFAAQKDLNGSESMLVHIELSPLRMHATYSWPACLQKMGCLPRLTSLAHVITSSPSLKHGYFSKTKNNLQEHAVSDGPRRIMVDLDAQNLKRHSLQTPHLALLGVGFFFTKNTK